MASTAPAFTGSAQRGQTLTATPGTWSGIGNTYAQQWQYSLDGGNTWTAIPGASALTYTLSKTDEHSQVRFQMTVSNPDTTVVTDTAPSAVVPTSPPVATTNPTVSGTTQRTYTLTATQGVWSGIANSYGYQWQHSSDGGTTWTNISGASASAYTLGLADEKTLVRMQVTASNVDATITAVSTAVGPVIGDLPANVLAPTVSGTPQRGSALSASPGTWSGIGDSYSYQWQSSPNGTTWTTIGGATSATYTPVGTDVGSRLEAVVTATDADGSATAASAPTSAVAGVPPVNTTAPSLSGTAQRAQTLTGTQGSWTGLGNSYAYQWQRGSGTTWTAITGATTLSYTLQAADENAQVRLQVTGSNVDATVSAYSQPTATVLASPPVLTSPPVLQGQVTLGGTVATVAGKVGTGFGGDGGLATAASINTPQAVAALPDGSFYLADAGNCVIRKVSTTGIISTVAGTTPNYNIAFGNCGNTGDGPATSVELNHPDGLTLDPNNPNLLYIVDTNNFLIRELNISTGQLSTIAGNGTQGYTGDGGPATSAELGNSETVAVGPDGTIYDADFGCNCIRAFKPGGTISTLANSISTPLGIAADPTGNWLYVAAVTGQVVYKVSTQTGAKTVIAGTGVTGYSGDGGPATAAELNDPHGLTLAPDGDVIFSDRGNCRIRAISPAGSISTIVGNGTCGFAGNGGPAGNVEVSFVEALNASANGNLYFTDTLNNQVRALYASSFGSSTLTATPGAWTGAGNSYTYQWQRSADGQTWTNIPGATTLTYTLQAADENDMLRFEVIASNPDATVTAASPASGPGLTAPPASNTAPTLSGTAQRGQVLTGTTGTWSGAGDGYTYQWQRSTDGQTWKNIAGAVSSTYTLTGTDESAQLRLEVTASNVFASAVADSQPTVAVIAAPPLNNIAPALSGTYTRDGQLTATQGTWSGVGNAYTYQWQRSTDAGQSWQTIAGQSTQTYNLSVADENSQLRVVVSATNPDSSLSAASTATPVIPSSPPLNSTAPAINGTALRGQTLSAANQYGTWTGLDNTYAYQWQDSTDGSNWSNIKGATASAYTLGVSDEHSQVRLEVIAANIDATTSAYSQPTTTIPSEAPVNTAPPTITGPAQRGGTLGELSPGTWTGLGNTYTFAWQRSTNNGQSWSVVAGPSASATNYTPTAADEGALLRAQVTATNPDAPAGVSAYSQQSAAVTSNPPLSLTQPTIVASGYQRTLGMALVGNSDNYWSGAGNTYTTLWQYSTNGGQSWQSETGPAATSGTWTFNKSDENQLMRGAVTATNVDGSVTAYSQPTPTISAYLPQSFEPLNIATTYDGQGLGQLVTETMGVRQADDNGWSGDNAYSWFWQRSTNNGQSWTNIPGATSANYTTTYADMGDSVRGAETATDPDGSVTIYSDARGPIVLNLPRVTFKPQLGGNTYREGVMGFTPGNWDGDNSGANNTYAYQYGRCDASGANCHPISGATNSRYTLVKADEGSTVNVTITATDTDGSASYTTPASAVITALPPTETGPLTISGQTHAGQTLSIANLTWQPSDAVVTEQWEHCDAAGNNCKALSGATGLTYAVTGADNGFTLRAVQTATNVDGSVSVTSNPTQLIASPPQNLTAPAAPSGTVRNGQTLTADTGAWDTPGASFNVSWQRCAGTATAIDRTCTQVGYGTTYTLGSADVGSTIGVLVTATSTGGASAPASSALSKAVSDIALQNLTAPGISGNPQVPQTLTAVSGTWTPASASTSYTWQRCDTNGTSNCTTVATATSSYALQAADQGHAIVLTQTATYGSQSVSAHSLPAVVQDQPLPQNTAAPAVSGTPVRAGTLSESPGAWTNNPTLAVQWESCNTVGNNCQAIAGATGAAYTPVQSDEGHELTVLVTATNASGQAQASAQPTAAVAAAPPVATHAPSLSALIYEQGISISVGGDTWQTAPDTTVAYSWRQCNAAGQGCAAIPGASTSTYTPALADVGHTIVGVATATNMDGSASSASAPSPVVSIAAPRWEFLPTIDSDPGNVGDLLSIHHGTWTGPAVTSDQVLMMRCTNVCVAANTDTSVTSYLIADADVGAILRVQETASNPGGTVSVWSPTYVGPVISSNAGDSVLKTGGLVAVRNTKGQTLATAQLQQTAPVASASAVRADIARRRPAKPKQAESVRLRRAAGVKGTLRAWVCPVPSSKSSGPPPKCTRQVSLTGTSTLKLPAAMTGAKLRVVVVHAAKR